MLVPHHSLTSPLHHLFFPQLQLAFFSPPSHHHTFPFTTTPTVSLLNTLSHTSASLPHAPHYTLPYILLCALLAHAPTSFCCAFALHARLSSPNPVCPLYAPAPLPDVQPRVAPTPPMYTQFTYGRTFTSALRRRAQRAVQPQRLHDLSTMTAVPAPLVLAPICASPATIFQLYHDRCRWEVPLVCKQLLVCSASLCCGPGTLRSQS